ncbi:MAG TPA: DHHA1 domain-containing protein [Candidatus Absconditabacterales bacterium]|nr:DHHA1 domain-containing protein [Candidatus Absconditabacterales bacterium]
MHYTHISVQLPHRLEDGYGIKSYHLDQIKEKGVSLVITVDNGITSITEALYAKHIGLDLIVTDHHQSLIGEHGGIVIPDAYAVVNPQVSPDYPWKGLCGAGVAFKLIMALVERLEMKAELKMEVLNRYLPIVAIATVADCVPLLSENRLLVKRGLGLINSKHHHLPQSLLSFLDHFNLSSRSITSGDIGFIIGPRLNAAGRMLSAYQALYALMYTGDKQKIYLESLGELNTERKGVQDDMIKRAIQECSHEHQILQFASDELHEGVIGIVAGRLTEQYYKPSVVYKIDHEKGIAVASLRGPSYFSVIDMLYHVAPLLDRFGGHKQAGGLTVSIDKLNELQQELTIYCDRIITSEMMIKKTIVDTMLYDYELTNESFHAVDALTPFGEGNREPLFLLPDVVIKHKQTMGKNGKSHLKLYTQIGSKIVEIISRNQGQTIDNYDIGSRYELIVSHRWDGDGRRYLVI